MAWPYTQRNLLTLILRILNDLMVWKAKASPSEQTTVLQRELVTYIEAHNKCKVDMGIPGKTDEEAKNDTRDVPKGTPVHGEEQKAQPRNE